ncbi:MAG: hypothetical protein VX265_17525 [Myxococcota bacterium]|nr:hypothetical protein [Myxococcota bacterium]MEC8422156.1 hypothetical protein [Myxococcota bacterium]
MTCSRLAPILLLLAAGCGSEDMPRTSTAASMPAATGAGEAPSAEGVPASPEPGTSSDALPDPWGRARDIRAAVGGGHYAKGIAGGRKYKVLDPRTGAEISVGIPLIVMDGDQPRAFPTSAHTGHVMFHTRSSGDEVVLDYRLHWDPTALRADGSTGGFIVDSVVVLQRGDAPAAARFVRTGEFWERETPTQTPEPAR